MVPSGDNPQAAREAALDPVNVANGEFVLEHDDLSFPPLSSWPTEVPTAPREGHRLDEGLLNRDAERREVLLRAPQGQYQQLESLAPLLR